MADTIELQNLAEEVLKLAKKYGAVVEQETEKAVEEQANAALAEMPSASPVSNNNSPKHHHLKDSWQMKKTGSGALVDFHIYAGKWHKYTIVHALENGHRSANQHGPNFGFVKAHAFMNAIQEKYSQKTLEAVKKAAEEASKKL